MNSSDLSEQHIGVFVMVVTEDHSRVLMGKRKNAYKSGYWGYSGGRLEIGESLEDCARRELFEETRLHIKSLNYIGVIREHQITYDFIHFVYLCDQYTGTVHLAEPQKCEGWEWVEVTKIPTDTLPAHNAGMQLFLSKKTVT